MLYIKGHKSNRLIGWVFEQDRQKIRDAEKDLDDFYRQDAIDDLNNAKDAELAILDERIKFCP